MGMTMMRWSAAVIAGCAVVAVALLPFPPNAGLWWAGAAPAPLAAEMARFRDAAQATEQAVRAYRAAQGLERWSVGRRATDTSSIRIDDGVPGNVADAVRQVANEQWTALGASASRLNAQIFVYVDSTTIPRAAVVTGLRPLDSRRFVDVVFALPEATDGAHCVTLVRLRGVSPAHVEALRRQSLVGVCGFFAAFGMPGRGVRAWLAGTGYRTARRSDWHVARAPAVDAAGVYSLSDAGGRCLTSQPGACVEALGAADAAARADSRTLHSYDWVIDGTFLPTASALGASRGALGEIEPELLLSAVRELGADRFGNFWRSSESPAAAFESAFGTSLDSWTHAWVVRTYGGAADRPTIRMRDVVWLALALPLLVAMAARRRERLLSERLLGARA